jgi:purine-binding chemotaxis protein CheW
MTSLDVSRIVTFRVGRDLFAADIASVERVLKYETPRSVPNMPPWLEGVIDYHGKVVPVVDLRRRFHIDDVSVAGQTRLLVLSTGTEWTAVVVDAVLDVRSLEGEALAPAPPIFRGLAGDFVRGMTRRNEQLVVVLDVAHLLATHEPLRIEPRSDGDAHAS